MIWIGKKPLDRIAELERERDQAVASLRWLCNFLAQHPLRAFFTVKEYEEHVAPWLKTP